MKNSEKTAYPIVGSAFSDSYKGLTKREYFAGLAMQAILSNPDMLRGKINNQENNGKTLAEVVINDCLIYTDELLKQLEK
jgi:hypothetical protein